ncbi:hypothetical protein ACGC1H_006668 [Rhizoctonia solani]
MTPDGLVRRAHFTPDPKAPRRPVGAYEFLDDTDSFVYAAPYARILPLLFKVRDHCKLFILVQSFVIEIDLGNLLVRRQIRGLASSPKTQFLQLVQLPRRNIAIHRSPGAIPRRRKRNRPIIRRNTQLFQHLPHSPQSLCAFLTASRWFAKTSIGFTAPCRTSQVYSKRGTQRQGLWDRRKEAPVRLGWIRVGVRLGGQLYCRSKRGKDWAVGSHQGRVFQAVGRCVGGTQMSD